MNDQLKFKLQNIPKKAGCYIWKNKNQEVIYVGKAKNLFNRTHQYFNNVSDYKTSKLVEEIFDVEYFVVDNENESLILENNLIKKYKPRFNVLLKESSGYPYIVVTNEQNPRLIYTRDNNLYNGKYYGPFASNDQSKYGVYTLLNQIFPLRKCKSLPKKKCIYYDLNQCLGPCINQIDQNEYKKIRNEIDLLFHNKEKNIIKTLQQKELLASSKLNYELANEYKNLSNSLKNMAKSQNVQLSTEKDIDFIAYTTKDNYLSINIFSYKNGNLLVKNQNIYEYFDNIPETISNYIVQFYINNFNKPKEVYLSLEKEFLDELSKTLNIKFINPNKGKKFEILNNTLTNAQEFLKSNYLIFKKNNERWKNGIKILSKILNIDNANLISVFDISNLFGSDKVGGMIVLENNSFNRKLYRKYIIKDDKSTSDYACMKEVINRYINSQKFNILPNLLIVDGGQIQVKAAKEALQIHGLQNVIPVLGLTKNNDHKLEYIYYDDKKILIDKSSDLYLYLLNISEEVHKYTINFFRTKNVNSMFKTSLSKIEGLGAKRINLLLSKYENVTKIKNASIEELSQIIPIDVAKKIKEKLTNND